MRRWPVGCAVVAVVSGACSAAGDPAASGPGLANGLRVPDGSTLVGAVAPSILPAGDHTVGWTALLTFTGDPVGVYRDFTRQARRLGSAAMPAVGAACRVEYRRTSGTGDRSEDVRCEGSTNSVGASWSVTVASCESCTPKVSAAEVQYRGVPARPIRRRQLPTPVASYRGPVPTSSWPILRGTRLLAQADLDQCQGGSRYTVLEVTGIPDAVWHRYLARYGSSIAFAHTRAVEARVDGSRVRQLLGGETGQSEVVTLVENEDLTHPVLTVDECSD